MVEPRLQPRHEHARIGGERDEADPLGQGHPVQGPARGVEGPDRRIGAVDAVQHAQAMVPKRTLARLHPGVEQELDRPGPAGLRALP